MSRDFHALVGAYLLGALDPDELSAFEKALEADPELRRGVAEYEEIVGRLAEAMPHQPRAPLEERVPERARAEGPPQGRESPGRGRAGGGRRLAALAWLVAAAGLAGTLGLGLAYRSGRQLTDALGGELARLEVENERLAGLLAGRDSLFTTLFGAGVRTASLSATGQPPAARLFWSPGTSRVVIAAFDLPPAPAGRVYQLWAITGDDPPVSLGTFQTGADGTAVVSKAVPIGIDFRSGAVTEEPAGGSPRPTTTPLLVGAWSTG